MAKKFVACPFCGGKIKDSAIKCMHCKKWLNIEENPNYQLQKEIKIELNETSVKDEVIKKYSGVSNADDKSLLWWIIGFQSVCLLGALINIL